MRDLKRLHFLRTRIQFKQTNKYFFENEAEKMWTDTIYVQHTKTQHLPELGNTAEKGPTFDIGEQIQGKNCF